MLEIIIEKNIEENIENKAGRKFHRIYICLFFYFRQDFLILIPRPRFSSYLFVDESTHSSKD